MNLQILLGNTRSYFILIRHPMLYTEPESQKSSG